jgi:hypothetical protein
LPKLRAFSVLACGLAVLAAGHDAPASAQGAHPAVSPPAPINTAPVPPQNRRVDRFTADMLEGMNICADAARQFRAFDPANYAADGWTIYQAGVETNAEGNLYDSIVLEHRPSIQVDVRQYDDYAECSVLSVVSDFGQADRVMRAVEDSLSANYHDEGDMAAAVLASENRAWGDGIDVRVYALYSNAEFLYALRQMEVQGSSAVHFETTPIEQVIYNEVGGKRTVSK